MIVFQDLRGLGKSVIDDRPLLERDFRGPAPEGRQELRSMILAFWLRLGRAPFGRAQSSKIEVMEADKRPSAMVRITLWPTEAWEAFVSTRPSGPVTMA